MSHSNRNVKLIILFKNSLQPKITFLIYALKNDKILEVFQLVVHVNYFSFSINQVGI